MLFGGTSEARKIAEALQASEVEALVCVASEYGESLLCAQDLIRVHTGKLDTDGMLALFRLNAPRLVIDATHPYATLVSKNIQAACGAYGVCCVRVLREAPEEHLKNTFSSLDELVAWLNTTSGVIFSTLGGSAASALTHVGDYRTRVYLRILPDVVPISSALSFGYPANHLVCMQGPFTRELNAAMFRAAKANILVTKDSGYAGGFCEKLAAANDCGMTIGLLRRPPEQNGVLLETLLRQIQEHNL